MFIQLKKCDLNLKLKSKELNDEMESIPGRKLLKWILEKGIEAKDWELEKPSEICSVNLDNVKYIKPIACCAKCSGIVDPKLVKIATEIHFKGGDYMFVEEDFEELSERLSKI